MIRLSDHATMLIAPDGSAIVFDAEELQTAILSACVAAGCRDTWFAEDIALSIEYALSLPVNQGRKFTLSDINSMVIRIMEETGYPGVAETYRRRNSSNELVLSAVTPMVSELISRHLGLEDGQLAGLSARVMDALKALNISQASPALMLELAKYYREQLFAGTELVPATFPVTGSPDARPVERPGVMQQLPDGARALVERGVLSFSGLSRIFPALKLDFRITLFVKYLQLDSPLTEMSVNAHFHELADAVNAVYSAAVSAWKHSRDQDFPVYLLVPDMSEFARRDLLSSWPEAGNSCRDMLGYLEDMLDFPLFKVSMK